MPKSQPPVTRAETPRAKKREEAPAMLAEILVNLNRLDAYLRGQQRETSLRLEQIEQRLTTVERNQKGAA